MSVRLERLPVIYRRIFAFILDMLVVDCLRHAFLVGYSVAIHAYFSFLPSSQKVRLMENLYQIDMALFLLLFMAYFTAAPLMSHGRTLGKLIMGLKIVPTGQGLPPFTCHLLRAMGLMVSYLSLGTLFLICCFRKDQRGLADFMADTMVIDPKNVPVSCPAVELAQVMERKAASSVDHFKDAA